MRRDRDRNFSDCARVAEQTQWRPMGWRQCLQGVLVALILSSISAIARPVDAAPDAPASERILHFDDRPLQLEVIVGFGTTVGISGLALDYSLRDMVALGVGAGLGIHGPLWEAHARFRPVLGHLGSQSDLLSALTVETAFSQGMYA